MGAQRAVMKDLHDEMRATSLSGMGIVEQGTLIAASQHRREAGAGNAAVVELLAELISEQRQTNRLLWAALPPQTQAQLRAEDEAAAAAAAEAAANAEPEKKRRWR